jgi:hypothetical protein
MLDPRNLNLRCHNTINTGIRETGNCQLTDSFVSDTESKTLKRFLSSRSVQKKPRNVTGEIAQQERLPFYATSHDTHLRGPAFARSVGSMRFRKKHQRRSAFLRQLETTGSIDKT